jgi:integrative and conjugative element protein (TIGR02256 family)
LSGVRRLGRMIFLTKGRLVTVADNVTQEISQYTTGSEADREAGGILLGSYRGPHIEVVRCTAPMPGDRRTRLGFVRRDKGHQRAAEKEWLESAGAVSFVGEWHTHPERHPTPSWVDRRSWRKQMGKRGPYPMVFLIAGSATTYCEIGSDGRLTAMAKVG